MDPKELLRVYHAALASGRYSLSEINADLKKKSGGRYNTYADLARAAFNVAEGERERQQTERVASRQPGFGEQLVASAIDKIAGGVGVPDPDVARGVGDFTRMATHGASFGFSDELADILPGGATKEEVRGRVEDLRAVEPTGALLSELAGGVAVPIGAGGAAARTGASTLARTARGVGVGAGTGAALGAVVGAGEAEGGVEERVAGARRGALGGGIFGGALGLVGPFAAKLATRLRGKTRGRRLARDIKRTSGVEDTLEEAFARADEHIAAVSEELYQPLDRAFEEVTDPGVLEALADPELRTIVRSVSKELASGSRPPTFRELQTIRNKARQRRGTSPATADAGDALNQEMQRGIPGLRDADREFARAMEIAEGLEAGRGWARVSGAARSSTMAKRMMNEFGDEGREAFAEGMIHGFVEQLELRDASPAMVRAMLDMGPEMRARIRNGFPSDETFNEFMTIVATEQSAATFSRRAKRFAKWLLIGSIGYGGFRAAGGGGGDEQ